MGKSRTSRKYAFTGEVKRVNGHKLRRIRCLSTGVKGGWIEHEGNLSHEGTCFVCAEACVYGEAHVTGKALVSGRAQVHGEARVSGEARVYGKAQVCGKAHVYDWACVCEEAQVYGKAHVYGGAQVYKDAEVENCLYLQQPKHDITATNTHAFIGCEGHTWQHWFEHVHEIGKEHEYSKKEILRIEELLSGVEECLVLC